MNIAELESRALKYLPEAEELFWNPAFSEPERAMYLLDTLSAGVDGWRLLTFGPAFEEQPATLILWKQFVESQDIEAFESTEPKASDALYEVLLQAFLFIKEKDTNG